MYDVIVVGAGPAGLTAGIYARRANKKVLILEANSYGGAIINTHAIDNFPTQPHINGFDFATKLYEQTKELGAEVKFEKVIEISDGKYKKVITNKREYETKTIILATGSDNRKLGLDKEKEFTGKGVSYCATCDGAFYKGKDVAVIGGGSTALDDAIYLQDIASKVYLINKNSSFKDDNGFINNLKDNVEVFYNTNITMLLGEDKLTGITLSDGKKLSIDGLFIAVGRVPENEKFSSIINVDDKGYIIAKEDCHTNIEGIYVAGDNRTKEVRQLTTAVSDGTVAAIEAIKYINNLKEE